MSEKNTDRKTQYVSQCWVARHTDQTLALDYSLSMPEADDNVPALMLHNQFSRFILTLIDNSTNTRKILKANIRADELPYLLERYDLAAAEHFRLQNQPKSEESKNVVSPAYSVQIRSGLMKGKTPAEILLADKSKESELTRHKQWLAENLKQWPTNQQIIDAIDDALYLLSCNKLSADIEAPKSSFSIFHEDFKIMSSGNGDTKLAVKVAISCEMDRTNPWRFSIENNEHPIENGAVNKHSILNQNISVIFLNGKEMAEFIDSIRRIKNNFERLSFNKAYKFVTEYDWRMATKT